MVTDNNHRHIASCNNSMSMKLASTRWPSPTVASKRVQFSHVSVSSEKAVPSQASKDLFLAVKQGSSTHASRQAHLVLPSFAVAMPKPTTTT